ncbi:MAG: DUF2065 domain-containing protein [Deltaproteobacteria bacterium]|uniref:DUF2065 domain-containing protein n=1 Tax=Candidatus Zymogenus saltonus TaxID=2844893 RepID=A0A9D8KCV3_9DELT|nr:DUF2065 domain-containing protein [Candidatus Zymogenus saltonus]
MDLDYKLIIVALGLMFIIEGIPYFAFPHLVKRLMIEALKLPDRVLRIFGFIALVLGLLFIYLGSRVLG